MIAFNSILLQKVRPSHSDRTQKDNSSNIFDIADEQGRYSIVTEDKDELSEHVSYVLFCALNLVKFQ